MSIQVNALVKEYGQQKAVNNISFQVAKGEIVGFLGPNGAGKSTTMKILTGYLQTTQGTAQVCGIDVAKDPLEAKKKIGYLPESNALYYDMYIKEYLAFIAETHGVKNIKEQVAKVIQLVGLTPEQHKKVGQLSKGYKQRVGLAAALIHDPEVLILDEPTSGLDPNQIIEIREVIKQQGQHKTVLFSSHILQEVEAICDRVVIINKGNLVADDKIANLQQANNNQQTVLVAFSQAVDIATLEQLDGVNGVQVSQGNHYQLSCSNAETVKKQVLQLSIDNSLDILSLQTGNQSLENIFRQLTGNNNAG
jgi:ABC-2 type transport system ATP-binding protein